MLTFDEMVSFESLFEAGEDCKKGLMWKSSMINFYYNLPINIAKISNELKNGKTLLGDYIFFKIYEPKERTIQATSIKDRIVQKALCNNGVYEEFTKHFILDNYACQKGKGLHFALERTRYFMRDFYLKHKSNEGYVCHLDVRKFFPSTPHIVIKENVIKKYIHDEKTVNYLCELVDSFVDPRTTEEIEADPFGARGTALGSQLSQLFQLAVLSDLDHKIKEKLHVEYYGRYMDDFLLIDSSKDKLIHTISYISEYLSKIGMKLKKDYKPNKLSDGFTFLKVKNILTETGKIISFPEDEMIFKEHRKLRKLKKFYDSKKIEMRAILNHYQSWIANSNKYTSEKFVRNMDIYFFELFGRWPLYSGCPYFGNLKNVLPHIQDMWK